MSSKQQRVSIDIPCLCESGTSFPQIHDFSPQGGALGSVMNIDTQINLLLLAIRKCTQCSNDARIIQDTFSTLKNVLLLLEAEQRVYITTSAPQSPEQRHGSSDSQNLSFSQLDAGLQVSGYSRRERFVFGIIVLDDCESTIIAKRLIRDAALRIGHSLRWIDTQCRSGIVGSIHQPRQFSQEVKLAMDSVKRIIARTS